MKIFCDKLGVTCQQVEAKLEKIDAAHYKCYVYNDMEAFYFTALSIVLKNTKSILEIGTGCGNTTKLLAKLFPIATIYTVDLPKNDPDYKHSEPRRRAWRLDRSDVFIQNLKHPNIKFIAANSFHLPNIGLPDKFDIIYIDGGHWFPVISWDMMFSYHRLRKGGHLLMHDYESIPAKNCNDVLNTVTYIKERIKEPIVLLPSRKLKPNLSAKVVWLIKE